MPTQQLFSYIMARTRYLSMRRWWCPLCSRPTCSVVIFYSASSILMQWIFTFLHIITEMQKNIVIGQMLADVQKKNNPFHVTILTQVIIGILDLS
jgi:hypothetical protein